MEINYALILSAGLGTRMGEIGKVIPKVMWPVFGIPLIDHQIMYCQQLGIKKIFINTHYLYDVLESHLQNRWGDIVTILRENPLLDSGGAIHNMAMRADVNYRGNVLLINGDQFYFFDKETLDLGLRNLNHWRASLFAINVNKGEKYNETIIKNNLLKSIEPLNETRDFITYSGTGLLKLDGLKKVDGASKFFKTVCDFLNEDVGMLVPKESEYWDFGTAANYFKSVSDIVKRKNENLRIFDFLHANGIDLSNINKYSSNEMKSVRLNKEDQFQQNCIVGYGINQPI